MNILRIESPVKVYLLHENEEIILCNGGDTLCRHVILGVMKEEEERDRSMMLRGLMAYYHENDSLNSKVFVARPTLEIEDDRRLIGVCNCLVDGVLSEEEERKLLEFISGQYSDGWGEGFEQIPIATDFGDVFVSFWDDSPDWKLKIIDHKKRD